MVYYADNKLLIRSMELGDAKIIYETYLSYGWHLSLEIYENYYKEQEGQKRKVFIAEYEGAVSGLGTLVLDPAEGPWGGQGYPKVFETPNMHVLNDAFQEKGYRVCFMAEYFLPDRNVLHELSCDYECKVLVQEDFADLYTSQWSNALCEARKEPDVLGVGAYDNGKLIGLAACSADCDTMWQIGIDVLPEYRRKGIVSALTSRLAAETLQRGKVPFYCCAWSNLKSAKNAIKSGFRPAWVEMTVKEDSFVNEMNQ